MTAKLKPCPFCGGEAEIYEYEHEGKKYFTVGCSECMITTQGSDNEQKLITIWNTRTLTLYQKYAEGLYDGLEYMLNITSDVLEAVSPLFHDLQSNLKDEPKQYQSLIDKIESEEAARHGF